MIREFLGIYGSSCFQVATVVRWLETILNAKKRLISYIAEARCNGCAINKKNLSAVRVPSRIRGCYRIIKVVSTRTSRLPLFELVAGTKLQGFSGHALLREQLWQRLR